MMHDLRISLVDEEGNEVASIFGDKLQLKWREYHYEDEDECSSAIFTLNEIYSLIETRSNFYNEEAKKSIKEVEEKTKEVYEKLNLENIKTRKLEKEIEILKEALKIVKEVSNGEK